MPKRGLRLTAAITAVLVPALGHSDVFVHFWRDGRGVAHYAETCPAGARCISKRIWGSSPASSNVSAAGQGSPIEPTPRGPYASPTPTYSATSQLPFGSFAIPGAGSAATASGGSASGTPDQAPSSVPSGSAPSSESPDAPSAPSGATAPSRLRSPIGTNLDGIAYWSPQLPFVNVMKSSSAWISGDSSRWDNGQPLDLDANGWVRSLAPGQIARKLMLREIGDRYPAGEYVVRYRGEGTMKFGFAAKVVSHKPGEMVIQVTPSSGGAHLMIEQTNPANYIRDIAITMPGGICEGDAFTHVRSAQECGSRTYLSFADQHPAIVFYPVFLDRLRSYSVLRFMDWMATNNSPLENWSQRTPLAYHTWATRHGAPPEVMIQLANAIGARPWFSIPHKADDVYVENLAQLIKATLDPALNVYVEHSNETWNTMFAQAADVVTRGRALGLDGHQYHALRSRTIGQIFKRVLGESRVVAILGTQAANTWTASRGLDYLKAQPYSVLGIDAVAIAPYFGVMPAPADAERFAAMTLDELFGYVRATELPKSLTWIANYRGIRERYKVQLIAYEGGQHMVGIRGAENHSALSALFDEFNRDPRIKQLYLDYLNGWKERGGELFVHFSDVSRYTKWGRWGALEYVSQPRQSGAKFDALQTFIENNPVWWRQ